MWQEQALPRLRSRGLGLDRAAETLRLTGIGESLLVEIIGKELLTAANPRLATYARSDSVDIRVSAIAQGGWSAADIVAAAMVTIDPLVGQYVYARGEDGWPEAIGRRIGARRLATVEAGTAGYLGLLLGTAPWLALGEQLRDAPAEGEHEDPAQLAGWVRAQANVEIGLAAVAYESGDDMVVRTCVDIEGHQHTAERSVFRGGDAGRRRAANTAAAELWKRLGNGGAGRA